MTKNEFLQGLRKSLTGLPADDLEERLAFYAEMIDDRVEEGMTEEQAVAETGTVEDVTERIISETPLKTLVKERVKPRRRLKGWETALLIIGSPVWFPLLIAALAVLFALLISFYAVIWSVVIAVFAVGAALAVSAVGCFCGAGALALTRRWAKAGVCLAASLILAGLSILWFFVCKGAVKAAAWLTKRTLFGVKSLFVGPGNKNSKSK